MTASAPCLAGVLSISFCLLFTVWVTPENQLAEFALRGSSVLTQDFRGPQMGFTPRRSRTAQFACISRLIEALSDSNHERHEEMFDWIGEFDSQAFSVESVNRTLTPLRRRRDNTSRG